MEAEGIRMIVGCTITEANGSNSKFEVRNSKQIRSSKIQIRKGEEEARPIVNQGCGGHAPINPGALECGQEKCGRAYGEKSRSSAAAPKGETEQS